MQENKYIVEMEKGGQIALHRLNDSRPPGIPVIIAHGTISNVDTVRDLGRYLAALGFDCWLMEWGGHGQSIASSKRQDFEYRACNDFPAAINTILHVTGQKQIYWVSHSGGGHLPLMYIARNPEYQEKIAGMVTIGAQATDAAQGFKYIIRAFILLFVTNLLGQTPKALLPAGTEGEPTRLIAQWARWNLRQKWIGEDGFNYMPWFTTKGANGSWGYPWTMNYFNPDLIDDKGKRNRLLFHVAGDEFSETTWFPSGNDVFSQCRRQLSSL